MVSKMVFQRGIHTGIHSHMVGSFDRIGRHLERNCLLSKSYFLTVLLLAILILLLLNKMISLICKSMPKHCEVFFFFLLEETPSQKIGFFCLYFLGCGIEGSVQIFQTFGRCKDTSCPDKSFSFCWWTLGRVKHGGRQQDRKRRKHGPCCSVFLRDCNLMHSSSRSRKVLIHKTE